MRITYRTLAALIEKMNDKQKDSDVIVKIPATKNIGLHVDWFVDSELVLQNNEPVILAHCDCGDKEYAPVRNVDYIARKIGLGDLNEK